MKYLFIAGHMADAPRKVGFHYWAQHVVESGHEAYFLTAGHSYLSLRKNKQINPALCNKWIEQGKKLHSMTWLPLFHPCLNRPVLKDLSLPFFRNYAKQFPVKTLEEIADTDIIVVESGPGLALVPLLAKACPSAKIIYEVSDRLKTVGAHPVILEAEKNALKHLSLIRVPAAVMLQDFPAGSNIVHIPQGLNKTDFDQPTKSPYAVPKNAVSIGDMLFDAQAIVCMAKAFPDWTFHLFGRNAKIEENMQNVIAYGEKPIQELTAYIQHADIGLAPYRPSENCEYLSQSSLKMIQYTYCRLPIVAPSFASSGRNHVLSYASSDDHAAVRRAFQNAIDYDRKTIEVSQVLTWNQVLDEMIGHLS